MIDLDALEHNWGDIPPLRAAFAELLASRKVVEAAATVMRQCFIFDASDDPLYQLQTGQDTTPTTSRVGIRRLRSALAELKARP